jgi:ABC-type oligopeptide transport system ATPase subunit
LQTAFFLLSLVIVKLKTYIMNDRKVTAKEATFRQWFASKYGNIFENHTQFNLPNTIANLDRQYQQDLGAKVPVSFNFSMDKLRMITDEIKETGTFDLFLSEYNAGLVISDVPVDAGCNDDGTIGNFVQGELRIEQPVNVEMIIENIDDMLFPEFKLFRTGTCFDRILSDYTEEGGLYGGTVTIVTGESGSGKSTLLIDFLSKVKEYRDAEIIPMIESRVADRKKDKTRKRKMTAAIEARYRKFLLYTEGVKVLYVSTEMTKNDIFFYKQKMPKIGKVPTLLAMNYIKGGLKDVIVKAFETPFDIILLDSYQDLVEKLKDLMGWKANYAENFLINLMVEAAERRGTAVLAIQHLTKGGEYVGRTFLKHTTTAMLELRFEGTQRYAEFSKNRRGGSMQNRPLNFNLKNNEIVFDVKAFERFGKAEEISNSETERLNKLDNKFTEVFNLAARIVPQEENE